MSQARTSPAPRLTTDDIVARAFAAAADAMIVSSPSRRVVSANAAACALFGYEPADLNGLPVRQLYGPEEDWVRVRDALTAAVSGASAAPCAATLRHHSGALFDAGVVAANVLDDAGRVCGIVETFRAASTGHGQQLTPAASQTNSPAVRLARGVAHDFNNLLAIITGNVQLAASKAADAAITPYLREAEQACEMGAQLTRRMMTFAEDRHLEAAELALPAVLKGQRALLKRALGGSTSLAFQSSADTWPVMTDRSAFENAILNLVLNARDAMPAGGSVTIAVANHRVADHDARAQLDAGDYVRIAVSDTGTGMPPAIIARAFDPFFTTKPPGRGTGLGLASVYGFAKQSGGGAIIDSAPGIGTTVALYLPARTLGRSKRA